MNRDHRVVMLVVRALAGALLLAVAGILVLAWAEKGVPDVITNIASAALGSLGTLLASTRTSSDPLPVQVENRPNDPVPVVPKNV